MTFHPHRVQPLRQQQQPQPLGEPLYLRRLRAAASAELNRRRGAAIREAVASDERRLRALSAMDEAGMDIDPREFRDSVEVYEPQEELEEVPLTAEEEDYLNRCEVALALS